MEEQKKDVKLTKVTEKDVAQLAKILQSCARTGEWIPSGISPDVKCKMCLGQGHQGRNVELDYYLLCPCIIKKVQEAMKFFITIRAQMEIAKKGVTNGDNSQNSTETNSVVEEGKISENE